jgi:hypothetical protein
MAHIEAEKGTQGAPTVIYTFGDSIRYSIDSIDDQPARIIDILQPTDTL